MMSGSMLAPWAMQHKARDNARTLAGLVSCPSESSTLLLKCLQSKSRLELTRAVNKMIKFGNISAIFAPVDDHVYMTPEGKNFFMEPANEALRKGHFKKVPILAGIMAEEGVLMAYFIKEHFDVLQTKQIL